MEQKKNSNSRSGFDRGSLAIQLHEKKLVIKADRRGCKSESMRKKAMELELVDEIMPLDEAIE